MEKSTQAAGVCIKTAQPSDFQAVVDLYNHYIATSAATFDTEPYTVESRRDWLEKGQETGRYRFLVARQGSEALADGQGRLLGFAASAPFRPKKAYETSVETSIYCDPTGQGKGLASALYEELFASLRGEDIHRAYALITTPNDASVALHKKFGFRELTVLTEVGRKFGRYWNVLWMEKPMA